MEKELVNGRDYRYLVKYATAAVRALGEKNGERIGEICSESICRLLEKVKEMDEKKGKMENYLYTIAKNQSYSQFKRRIQWNNIIDSDNYANAASCNIEKQIEAQNQLEVYDNLIKSFSGKYQKIYYMLKGGYTNKEMSQELGVSINSLYISIHYLRKQLKNLDF